MKKLMTLMLGMALVLGSTVVFADDAATTKTKKTKASKTKKTKASKTKKTKATS
jgi:hypothetical protein